MRKAGAITHVTTREDPFVKDILSTGPMRRLSHVGFLGAIDMVQPVGKRIDRREHSVGVTHLANVYASRSGIDGKERLLLLAAGLLHDAGHGPLSHTLEPVFSETFGMDHHSYTEKIVRGEVGSGVIRHVLTSHELDPDEVIVMINGEHQGPGGFLFSGP